MDTGDRFWYDEADKTHRALHDGEIRHASFLSGAVGVPGLGESATETAAKHIIVNDLLAAAKALKIDLGHLDRPAGVLAVIGSSPTATVSSSTSPDLTTVARALPEKLLRRLSAFRGEWSEDRLKTSLVATLDDLAVLCSGQMPVAAIALTIGYQITSIAAPGTEVVLASQSMAQDNEGPAQPLETVVVAPVAEQPAATICRQLTEDSDCIILVML